MGGLDLNIIKDVGAVGILLLVILMIARGYLVPRRTVDALLAEKQAAIEFWKAGVTQREEALKATYPLLEASVENHKTVVKLMNGMQETVGKLATEKENER